jgi:hypothetical protein
MIDFRCLCIGPLGDILIKLGRSLWAGRSPDGPMMGRMIPTGFGPPIGGPVGSL